MTSRKSSILKPGRVREPLQDLSQLIPNNDDEETTTTDNHKRRVSFAPTNKIKEFEAGAECTTLLHTPAYDERFSISSDSYQSSLCEQSHSRTNIETIQNRTQLLCTRTKSPQVNDENVDIIEVALFDMSRTGPSPGKISAGETSMDITDMISPNGYVKEDSGSEICYPLNLTKSYMSTQSAVQTRSEEEDILESSSMETTEAITCAMTETILTNTDGETYNADLETSAEEEIPVHKPVFPTRRMSRKSEIFLKDKPASKRLSDEMIDSDEQNMVTVKRRSLTNDSSSDESIVVIEKVPPNRKSLFQEALLESQNIKTLVIREEKSITIDNTKRKTEIKEVNNVNVDVTYEKSRKDKKNFAVNETHTIETSQNCDSTTQEINSDDNDSREEIYLNIEDIVTQPSEETKPVQQPKAANEREKSFMCLDYSLKPTENLDMEFTKVLSTNNEPVEEILTQDKPIDQPEPISMSLDQSIKHYDEKVEIQTTKVINPVENPQEIVSVQIKPIEQIDKTSMSLDQSIKQIAENAEIRTTRIVDTIENLPEIDSIQVKPIEQFNKTSMSLDHSIKQYTENVELQSSVHATNIDSEKTSMLLDQSIKQIANTEIETTRAINAIENKPLDQSELIFDIEPSQQSQPITNKTNHATQDMEITRAVRDEMDDIISLICSQDDKSVETQDAKYSDNEDGEVSSMVVEYDLEDVIGNLKAVNVTEIDQESFHEEKLDGPGSLELIRNPSPEIILVGESSSESTPVTQTEENRNTYEPANISIQDLDASIPAHVADVSMHSECEILDDKELIDKSVNIQKEINTKKPTDKLTEPARVTKDVKKSQYLEKRHDIVAKIRKLIKTEKSPWNIKSVSDEEWIFESLWKRLQLIISFTGIENNCTARLRFQPVNSNDEILRIAIGPILRKFKPKLDILCGNIDDVKHLLVLTAPEILFAANFAESFADTLDSWRIQLSDGIASFQVASLENHLLVKIEVKVKYVENVTIKHIKVTPQIGNVDIDLIYNTFTEAGRDYDFFSKFVNSLWKKLDTV